MAKKAVLVIVGVIAVIAGLSLIIPKPDVGCECMARCIQGKVTQIIDGDTIRVEATLIRFTLSSAPEMNTDAGKDARNFVEGICPVGSSVTVDEDDGQTQGSYGRILGVIYCNGQNLNEKILDEGHGVIAKQFCQVSEFADSPWAKRHGC